MFACLLSSYYLLPPYESWGVIRAGSSCNFSPCRDQEYGRQGLFLVIIFLYVMNYEGTAMLPCTFLMTSPPLFSSHPLISILVSLTRLKISLVEVACKSCSIIGCHCFVASSIILFPSWLESYTDYIKDLISSLLQMKQVTANLGRQEGGTDDHNMDSGTIRADKIVSLDKQEGECSKLLALDKVKQVIFFLCVWLYYLGTSYNSWCW